MCRGVEQLVARWAHNPKVGGSSPSPAPIILFGANIVSVKCGEVAKVATTDDLDVTETCFTTALNIVERCLSFNRGHASVALPQKA